MRLCLRRALTADDDCLGFAIIPKLVRLPWAEGYLAHEFGDSTLLLAA